MEISKFFLTAEGQHKFSKCQYARFYQLRNAFYGEIYAKLSTNMNDFLGKGKVLKSLGLPYLCGGYTQAGYLFGWNDFVVQTVGLLGGQHKSSIANSHLYIINTTKMS